ncbi:MAG: glutathione ABC transporter ATP-binding protein, partial [Oscillospiraceae bacterium]
IVMYAGNGVEQGAIDDIIEKPLHPYTILLLSSTPEPFRKEKLVIHASEDLPDLTGEMQMCPFVARCPKATERCKTSKPENYQVGNREVKCFLYEHAKTVRDVNIDVSIYA